MFKRPNILHMLESILADYNKIAKGDSAQLRRLIPPSEIWRLFIEKPIRQHGKN